MLKNVQSGMCVTLILTGVASLSGCGTYSGWKDETAGLLNPRKIHGSFDRESGAYKAGQVPVKDCYSALEIARTKYGANQDGQSASFVIANQDAVVNYVAEGMGLVDSYCSRWFQGLDDMNRMLAYQNKNVNVITQLGTALLGVGGANTNIVAGYGASTTAYAGASENFNAAFLVAPTANKVKEHIVSVMATEAQQLRQDSRSIQFKEAYSRLEKYADLCTHARAKAIVDSALELTKIQISTTNKQVETVTK